MSGDRIAELIASQKRYENLLESLAGAVRNANGLMAALEQEKLSGRLGPMGETIGALLGQAEPTIGSGVTPAGNTNPKVGQGNNLIDPGLDTVNTLALTTSEQGVSWDLFGLYVKNSGTAPSTLAVDIAPLGAGSSMASSMLTFRIAGAASAVNLDAKVYTKSALTISANTPALPYIVASARVYVYGSPRNVTNVTTWTAKIELLKNTSTVVNSMTVDLLALDSAGDYLLYAFATTPFTATDVYDMRVTISFVGTGSASTDVKVGIGEISLEQSITPDPTAFIADRTGSRFWFGDGSDGNVTIASGTTTLTRDMLYENLTVAAGAVLAPAGYKVFCRNRLTNAGTIRHNGANASGQTGAAGAAAGSMTAGGGGGSGNSGAGAGADGAAGTGYSANGVGGAGGGGGTSTSSPPHYGGSGGASAYLASRGAYRDPTTMRAAMDGTAALLSPGGGGGGGGGGNLGNGVGGGGGGGGGMVVIVARHLDNSAGIIEANGGNGANGTGTGGGGGGGGGGAVLIVYAACVRGTERATKGTKGTGGANNAADGSVGQVLYARS